MFSKGANCAPTLNSDPVPMYTALLVEKGSKLSIKSPEAGEGSRSYICVGGGIGGKKVLNSYSVDVRAGLGPMSRMLTTGVSPALNHPTSIHAKVVCYSHPSGPCAPI